MRHSHTALLVLLATAACDGDPARIKEGPRYVWVDEYARLTSGDTAVLDITGSGCAFAMAPPERDKMEANALLFVDATLRDTLGYAGSAWFRPVTPSGDTIRGDAAGCPRLKVELTGEMAARRGRREALLQGTKSRAGYPACGRLESLEAWSAALTRKDTRAMDSLAVGQSCVVLREGLPVSRPDTAVAGNARVHVYAEEEAVQVWIPAEAIAGGR